MIKRYSLALGALLLFAASCKNDKDLVNATVVDTGDITNVGCGYLLRLEDSAFVQPDYLPSNCQHGGLAVKVKYTHTGVQDTCKFGSVVYDLVSIQKIKLAND
jgi:hypothetical protein